MKTAVGQESDHVWQAYVGNAVPVDMPKSWAEAPRPVRPLPLQDQTYSAIQTSLPLDGGRESPVMVFRAMGPSFTSPVRLDGPAVIVGKRLEGLTDALAYLRASGHDVIWYRDLDLALGSVRTCLRSCGLVIVDSEHLDASLSDVMTALIEARQILRRPTLLVSRAFASDGVSADYAAVCDGHASHPLTAERFETVLEAITRSARRISARSA